MTYLKRTSVKKHKLQNLLYLIIVINIAQSIMFLAFREQCNLLQRDQSILTESLNYSNLSSHVKFLQLKDLIKYEIDGGKS